MDRKWRKIDLPKPTKYCTKLVNFNQYLIIMLKNFPIPKFNHRRSVSADFQMGCFALFDISHMVTLEAIYSTTTNLCGLKL
ncbi:hypothetical protein T02_14951 [Trichinella nativa]|uniref:Uncharacterized protein n=1 Tax=Trichinella nativa TaxID=6335 RepID=A0A0V1KN72_9BILA|nr:hypothetical protein T02_14951 [Trichinella nativa]